MNSSDLDSVVQRLSGVYGMPAWNARLGHGSFVTMEFGQPRAESGHGAYHLWIYGAAWRWETSDRILAACEDDREVLASTLEGLNTLAITEITIEQPSLSTRFDFDDGSRLLTFPVHSYLEDYEHWMMFLPDGDVFTAGPGSDWVVEPANQAR